MNRVAILGLGNMGSGMARRLLQEKLDVTVYNRRREVAAPFANEGARVAESAADAARGANIVISMVADDDAARAVWLGETGALASVAPDTILVESSTVTPTWIEELAAAAAIRHCPVLDAPVTGSKAQAAAGELLFLAGGEAEVLERARPVLAVMSRGVLHLGAIGAGARMKLINNFICGVQVAALAEAMAMITHLGLDRDQALALLNQGAPGSPIVKTISARMTEKQYDAQFSVRLMEKDLTYAVALARSAEIDLTTAQAAAARFHQAVERGLGNSDLSAVAEVLLER